MTLPTVITAIAIILSIVGVICGILLWWGWKPLRQALDHAWPKLVVECVQSLSALISIGASFAAVDKNAWFWPAVACASSLLIWKILQILLDRSVRQELKLTSRQLRRAKHEGELRQRLLTIFRKSVSQKVKRLSKWLVNRGGKPTVVQVRNALTPKPHLEEQLEALALFFQEQRSASAGQAGNFRIGVYLNRNGFLTPAIGIDLNDPGYDPFSSYRNHKARFEVAATDNPAHAVRCVREKRLIIEEDCVEAQKQGKFAFFYGGQKAYLRSMVAYYLGNVCDDDGKMKEAALVVDCNVPGFFREKDRARLNVVFREFASRLKLETLLSTLIA
jgi:hypothetical protein